MNIFISHSSNDSNIAFEFYNELLKYNHKIIIDNNFMIDSIEIGKDWAKEIDNAILDSDVIILIVSENSIESNYVKRELMQAIGYMEKRGRPKLFPFIIGGADKIPLALQAIQCYIAKGDIHDEIKKAVDQVNKYLGFVLAEKQEDKEIKEIIKQSFDIYIDDVFDKLNKNEKNNKILSYICYGISLICLAFAVLISITNVNAISINIQKNLNELALHTITIALIVGISRLMYILGKSFMVESIRNGDRIHAISFGKFYLNAYGNVATREEIKEVFGSWNIDNGSSFITQDPKDIDPNVLGALEIIKSSLLHK